MFQKGCTIPHSGTGTKRRAVLVCLCSLDALKATWESQSCLLRYFESELKKKKKAQSWVLNNLPHNDFVKSWTWVSACQLG